MGTRYQDVVAGWPYNTGNIFIETTSPSTENVMKHMWKATILGDLIYAYLSVTKSFW